MLYLLLIWCIFIIIIEYWPKPSKKTETQIYRQPPAPITPYIEDSGLKWDLPDKKVWTSYKEYLKSTEWQAIRKLTLKRDDYQCVMCGNNKTLQIHHLTYNNLYHEKLSDLIVLCNNCHIATHLATDDKSTAYPPKRKES